MELWIFGLYILIGPLAWGLYALTMINERPKLDLLNRFKSLPTDPPRITILVPAKDEGKRIRDCLLSTLNQDYPFFDVVAINDRSDDNTGQTMDELAAQFPQLKVVHIPHGRLPEGWTGKNHALHVGSQLARGEFLCFVDSDVILEPSAITKTVGVSLARHYDLISLLPRLESHSLWESSLLPLAAAAATTMYLISLTNSDHHRTAFANGQVLIIRRNLYDRIGGHEAVKDKLCEDMAIARRAKELGVRVRVSWGRDVAAVRMYTSLKQIIRGWSRIYYSAKDGQLRHPLSAIAAIMITSLSLCPALLWALLDVHQSAQVSQKQWLLACAAHVLACGGALGLIYHWSGNRLINVFLYPLNCLLLLYILLKGLMICFTKRVEWRGTRYQHSMQNVGKPA